MSSSDSAPSLCATGCHPARPYPLALLVFVLAVALGFAIGMQFPGTVAWICVAVVAAATAAVSGRAVIAGRRLLYRGTPTKLVAVYGDTKFDVVLWSRHLLVGRDPCCDIILSSPQTSRQHCRLVALGRRVYVDDLGSQNGTYINGRPLRTKRLRVGDRLTIGDRDFVVK